MSSQIIADADAARDSANWNLGIALYSKAIALSPNFPRLVHNRALCLLGAGRFIDAIADCKYALSLDSSSWQTINVLAKSQEALGLAVEADDSYRTVLLKQPENPTALLGRANLALNQFGDPLLASASVTPLLLNNEFSMDAQLTQLMACLYDRDVLVTAKDIANQAMVFAHQHLQLDRKIDQFEGPQKKQASNRPRIGLLSNSFCASPVYYLTINKWKELSNSCDIVIFNRGHKADWATSIFKDLAFEWIDVQHFPGDLLAKTIFKNQVDILYDLGGWMDPVGLQALSLNPSPKQMKWVGGQSLTTGLDCFSGWVGDVNQSPNYLQHLYSEPLILMPGYYAQYTQPEYMPKTIGHKTKTPCVYSNPAKVSRAFLTYLKKLPGKKVFIHHQYQYAKTRKRIEEFLGNQAEFIVPSSHQEALMALNQHSVMIDTFPYTSGLTAFEAQALGTKIHVTKIGELFCERHTAIYQ